MSCHEAQGGRAVPVVDTTPGYTAPASPELRATGQLGVPVLIAPLNHPQQREGATAAGSQMTSIGMAPFQGFLILQQEEKEDRETQRKKWFKEMRGWLMVLATVAASVTYQAGLNPPGGFWQDAADVNHNPGNPVLRDMLRGRYLTFFYFNSTAFVTSLVIMVLLMSERFYHTDAKVMALMFTTLVDLASLVGAYIAGTTRYMSSCIYIIVITCVSFVCVIYMGEAMTEICVFIMRKVRCMRNLAQLNWFPVPAEVRRRATPEGEAEEHRRRVAAAGSKSRCCPCCARPATSDQKCDVEEQ